MCFAISVVTPIAWLSPIIDWFHLLTERSPFVSAIPLTTMNRRTEVTVSFSRRVPAPLSVARPAERFRAHPPFRVPRQSQACDHLATLLSIARRSTTSHARDNRRHFERCLALSQLRWADAGHRKVYSPGDPTPFSANTRRRRRMRSTSTSRNFRMSRGAQYRCVFLSYQFLLRDSGHRICMELIHIYRLFLSPRWVLYSLGSLQDAATPTLPSFEFA
jgi:hypothetical protein